MRQIRVLLFVILALLPLHFVWAATTECSKKTDEVQVSALSATISAPLAMSAAHPAWVAWQFLDDGAFDVIERVSAPEWSNVDIDHFSCRIPPTDSSSGAPACPDPHEAHLPMSAVMLPATAGDAAIQAAMHPPLSAFVFGILRPPTLAA